MKKYYNIHMASKLTGLSVSRIRKWEERHNALSPMRKANGYRAFCEEDIRRLVLLKRLIFNGFSIGEVANLSDQDLKDISCKYVKYSGVDLCQVDVHQHETVSQLNKMLLIALENFRLDVLSYEIQKAIFDMSLRRLALDVVSPLFQEVGVMCSSGVITIAQEHSLSAIVQFYLGGVISDFNMKYREVPTRILIAAPEKELHSIGLLLSALLCVHYFHKFVYLGTNLPAKSLIEAACALKAEIIILGTCPGYEKNTKMSLEDYVYELQLGVEESTSIWVGGAESKRKFKHETAEQVKFIPNLVDLDQVLAHL